MVRCSRYKYLSDAKYVWIGWMLCCGGRGSTAGFTVKIHIVGSNDSGTHGQIRIIILNSLILN